jgi:hypothetical protein
MDKLPWAKYFFAIWIVALLASMVAKYITNNWLVLAPLCILLYWVSVKSLGRVKGY